MFPQEVSSILFVCVWSLASVGVGVVCGFFMGRFYTLTNEPKRLKREREQTMKALLSVMNCTAQLNDDVGNHNSALESAAKEIASVESDSRLVVLQAELMNNISEVVESNKKLENDLIVSKYALEPQAQELDNSRKEARKCVRPEDFVGRLGGDEFVIILDGLTDENADLVGTRIRSTIELYDFSIADSGQSTVVTMSMGLAVVCNDDDASSLYERADKALYKSKELGRNRLYTIVDDSKSGPATRTAAEEENESYDSFKASFGDASL